MANENPSRENPSRQQSAERSQNLGQQGTGTQGAGTRSGATQGSGSYGQGGYGQGGQGEQARGSGTSTSQGGRQTGGNLQRRGSQGMSPYSGYSQGYGGGPFSVMRRISDEMDRLFENFGMGRGLFGGEGRTGFDVGGYGEGAPSMWSPHVEVCERNGKLLIQADLPGMKRDDVHVRVEQDQVIIQGERRQEQQHDQGEYYRSERSYGSFYRTIPLPEGSNTETATASFRDGVLEIEVDMPRHQERGRTLEIREGGSSSSSGMQSGSYAGTGSGATYGSGTSGSMQGSTSGATGAGQHAGSGTSGSQQSSGTGTMYSGSGDPSAGAAGVAGGSEDRTKPHGNR